MSAILKTARELERDIGTNIAALASRLGFAETTAGNVVRDLVMFGVARREGGDVFLTERMEDGRPISVLNQVRQVLRRHALTLRLEELPAGGILDQEDLVTILRRTQPTAGHSTKTWRVYGERIALWLSAAGYIVHGDSGWQLEDVGEPNLDALKRRSRDRLIFLAEAPPARTVEALIWLNKVGSASREKIKEQGFRNAVATLVSLRLVSIDHGTAQPLESNDTPLGAVWAAARRDPTLQTVVEIQRMYPKLPGAQLGAEIGRRYQRDWSPASQSRSGNAFRQWGGWLASGSDNRPAIPPRLDLTENDDPGDGQGSLFT